ncbi:MAG: chemotaxis protein CheX [Pelosinus sp.]|nr:chemotaxis protein CheX [Pelosinus sp.]
MDVRLVNPFVDAIAGVMPQLGFQSVSRSKMTVQDQYVLSKGVVVIVGLTDDVKGNVVYNLSEESVKAIASVMMMGMPVTKIDNMVQSAISELANMITGNAAVHIEKAGFRVDISTPSLVVGPDAKVKICGTKFLVIELMVDDIPMELNIGIE